jgi:gluconokinase
LTSGAPRAAIIVMGVSGSGKSTVGRQLAHHWSAPFIEGDDLHPSGNIEKMRSGIPLDDEDRWPWLDRIAQAFGAASVEHAIVVGTCSALRRAYRDRLRERIPVPVLFISLEADEPVLSARMKMRSGHYMPSTLLASQLATYERPDEKEGAVVFDAQAPLEDLLAQLDARLRV